MTSSWVSLLSLCVVTCVTLALEKGRRALSTESHHNDCANNEMFRVMMITVIMMMMLDAVSEQLIDLRAQPGCIDPGWASAEL